jgi:hypothetical protein
VNLLALRKPADQSDTCYLGVAAVIRTAPGSVVTVRLEGHSFVMPF